MTERLRELLEEAGASAPAVRVREDTWRRARRTRVVELVVAPVLVMAVLVLGGLAVGSRLSPSVQLSPPAQLASDERPEAPALPSQLYQVPEWVESSGDLAVGPLSVVWSENGRTGVVGVRAVDGAYVALDLPGFETLPGGFSEFAQGVALSADGLRLAYAWEGEPDLERRTVPGGYAIVDLLTGEVARHEIDERGGVSVEQLAWSANGRHLALRAAVWDPLTSNGTVRTGGEPDRWELVDVEDQTSLEWEAAKWWVVVPTHNGDGLLGADGARLLRLDASGRVSEVAHLPTEIRGLVDTPAGVVAIAADGTYVVRNDDVTRIAGPVIDHRGLLLAGSSQRMVGLSSPFGPVVWREIATTRQPVEGLPHRQRLFDGAPEDQQLFSVSVALDLLDFPRRDFAEPDWPTNPRLYWLGAGGALGTIVLVLLWRRRQQH